MKEAILVVDDTPTNLMVIASLLNKAGYRVLVAESGASALDLVKLNKPNLILLDIMMPHMDGYQTCERLKSSEDTQSIPVLFMTAKSEVSDKVKAFEAGGVDYITKPYQMEEVLARISAHLTIARQKLALEKLLAEKNRFMNIAAHDLRNPLTVIQGWAEIGELSMSGEDSRNIFLNIRSSVRQMASIINDFLALQVVRNRSVASAEAFNVHDVIKQLIDQESFAASSKQITLLFPDADCANSQPAVGNVAHTHQILSNFLSNAIKYSPNDTNVRITAEIIDNRWHVSVKDQGPGIAPGERNKLFVEFARISNKPTGGETSTGLGLSIVKNLAEAQGGKAGACFPEEGGSIFWVEIPAGESSRNIPV